MDAQTIELPDSGHRADALPTARWGSILFSDEAAATRADGAVQPDCFRDLRLDAVVAAVTRPYAQFRLEPLFHAPLATLVEVGWRQAIVRDCMTPAIADGLRAFAVTQAAMRAAGDAEAAAYHPLQKLRWRFDARAAYAAGIVSLVSALTAAAPSSAGLRNVHGMLIDYVASAAFQDLWSGATDLDARLKSVRYSIRTEGSYVEVGAAEAGHDFGAETEELFARFQQDDGSAPSFTPDLPGRMTQLEEQILERVALLNRPLFAEIDRFCSRHADFLDPLAERLDRELHFYLAYLDFAGGLAPLPFTLPGITDDKAILIEDGVDLALAASLEPEARPVANNVQLAGRERMAVITGPNQGGKTTFARMVGQIHYLALLGLPVPAANARLFLCDAIFTHFERQESLTGPGGKLHDDVVRIHQILDRVTDRSLVILNEIFTSTTLEDARRLSRAMAGKILARDMLCVWVTFLDELAALSEQTVSLVAEVAPDDVAKRTYRICPRPPDGLAYALALADKYGLTEQRLRERLAR